MSLFTDILKGLPENAVLRDKVREAEANQAKLETDNAILKDYLREAQAEIATLKKQIEELSHYEQPNETELEFLKAIAAYDELAAEQLAEHFKLNLQRVRYHLEKLEGIGYVGRYGISVVGEPIPYYLTKKGRGFMVANELL